VPIEKSSRDPRPESFKVRDDGIRVVAQIPPDKHSWAGRRDYIFRNTGWHYGSVGALKSAQRSSGKSIGLVTPGGISDVRLIAKPADDRRIYAEKMAQIQSQPDMFRNEYKDLEFLPYEIRLRWSCSERCEECPHDMMVLDWGLFQLARKAGWEKARDHLADLANLQTHDFKLFMGSFRQHMTTFGIIGLWYPPRTSQGSLL
jgi:hypothetical protein